MSTTRVDYINPLEESILVFRPETTGIAIPKGTTSERPAQPQTGMLRFNTETTQAEIYGNDQWWPLPPPSSSNQVNLSNPGPIGSTTPAKAAFTGLESTNLVVSSAVSDGLRLNQSPQVGDVLTLVNSNGTAAWQSLPVSSASSGDPEGELAFFSSTPNSITVSISTALVTNASLFRNGVFVATVGSGTFTTQRRVTGLPASSTHTFQLRNGTSLNSPLLDTLVVTTPATDPPFAQLAGVGKIYHVHSLVGGIIVQAVYERMHSPSIRVFTNSNVEVTNYLGLSPGDGNETVLLSVSNLPARRLIIRLSDFVNNSVVDVAETYGAPL